MKKNPILLYLFEATNIISCLVFPCMLFFNIGGWFYPSGSQVYSGQELLGYIKNVAILGVVFTVIVGIPLLLLLVDCFVIMRDVKGFRVSALSIITAPASYPIIRTEFLEEKKAVRKLHTVAGAIIFISNSLVISSLAYYFMKMMKLAWALV